MPVNRITQTTYSLDGASPFLQDQYVETSLHPQVVEAIASGDVEDYRDPRYHNVKLLSDSGMLDAIRTGEDWSHDLLESEASPELAT